MKKLSYMLALVAVGTLGLNAIAQASGYRHTGGHDYRTPAHRFEHRVDRRQAKQRNRINDRIDSGDLTRREARRLHKDQRHIARMERRFEADGYYSPREQRSLKRALDRASRRIKRAAHNDFDRPYNRHQRAWHHGHHRYAYEPYAYEESDDSYVVSRSSSTTVSAQTDGFSVSWSTSEQE